MADQVSRHRFQPKGVAQENPPHDPAGLGVPPPQSRRVRNYVFAISTLFTAAFAVLWVLTVISWGIDILTISGLFMLVLLGVGLTGAMFEQSRK